VGSKVNNFDRPTFEADVFAILLGSKLTQDIEEAHKALQRVIDKDISNDDIRDKAMELLETLDAWYEKGLRLRKKLRKKGNHLA